MHQNQQPDRWIIKGLCIGVLAGSAAWMVLLIKASLTLRTGPIGTADVSAGPLLLAELTKKTVADGSQLIFSFHFGLITFLGVWALVGVALGACLHHYKGRQREAS